MLATSGVGKEFWAEALHTSAYIVNKCPSTGINLKTPMEVWTGFKPDLSGLRTFGCAAYAHHHGDKLGSRAVNASFLATQME